ncbi:MAG: DNA repair protein RecO [Clostridium sp.]|nr:DNA repair protein RecO [Clostridium sp.]
MRELVNLTGMVLSASPVGEYDKRLVILTRERGKITAFARGAKRNGSTLRAASNPFVFGTFSLGEGRDAYNLYSVEAAAYFEDIAMDVERACYASYFAEFASYYGREGIEAGDMLLLLYQSLRALLQENVPNPLVRRIFELKLMMLNGEYTEKPAVSCGEAASYAWDYVVHSPAGKLYSFLLSEESLSEFARAVERNVKTFTDRNFRSLAVLEMMRQ